ncbi:MAG TPA: hypothetical protein VGS58_00285 [Candidatus Sulfopaludibacter sp.]|nr:hypothetical protein [Candidatus Sulfopaludibacter sp.]
MGDAVQAVPEAAPAPAPPTPAKWSLGARIAYRFLCCYLMLYMLPDQGHVELFGAIPFNEVLTRPYVKMWRALVPWVAIHVFHLSGPATVYPPVNGSGDSTLDYVQHFCYLAIAAVAALVWSVLDRKRPNYRVFHAWMHVFVRYALAFTMFGYGFAKVIPTQFGPPSLSRLIEPLGDFSPMGLLWTFVGYSKAYTIFSGAAEVSGGALLLWRRTATLGAMVSAAVLANVVAMNFCYDVPVKLYSANLLLMAGFLMAGDLRRVVNCLILNRPAAAADLSAGRFPGRRVRIAVLVFQVLFVGSFLYQDLKQSWQFYSGFVLHPKRPPLYGLYEVESFRRNGQDVPPLLTDATRWKRVILQTPAFAALRLMDDSPRSFGAEYDAANKRLTLTTPDKQKNVFQYSQPDADHVVLEGRLGGANLVVGLRKVDVQKFLLVNRGFHWINERPFNR